MSVTQLSGQLRYATCDLQADRQQVFVLTCTEQRVSGLELNYQTYVRTLW
jgi:hypothetical protein